MVQATSTARVEEESQPRLYDMAEGYGSLYGRYVRKLLCQRLVAQYGIRTVLEVPCNSEGAITSADPSQAVFPGTQSVAFAQQGCAVVLLHPDKAVADKTRAFWATLPLAQPPVIHHQDLYHLPFAEGQFDFVWNFDYVAQCEEPARFIGETARVSGRFVLILVINAWNYGYPLHALLNRLRRRQSSFGPREWMSLAPVERALRACGFTPVERGLVDVPPWPTFNTANLLGRFIRRSKAAPGAALRSDAETERMLRKLTFIEHAPLPSIVKRPFAHQLYVLARRQTAR